MITDFLKLENKNVDLIRYGPKRDMGYVVPNLSYTKCITIGIGNNVQFEVDLATKNYVEGFLFDHTVDTLPQDLPNSKFYKIGLGSGENLLSLTSILDICSLSDNDVTLLKIDCEGGEWEAGIHFTDLSKISALVMEIHNLDKTRMHRHYTTILKHISENFTLVNIHGNNYGGTFDHNGIVIPKVIELSYVSNKKLDDCIGNYVDLNYKSRPNFPDVSFSRIPKIIHTCWMSEDPYSPLHQKCLDSWKKYLPEYEIKIWNSKNWDVNKYRFSSEAFKYKQWAFVSDVVRLDVVYEYGGIWLDFDAEVLGPLDQFLYHEFFTGTEVFEENNSYLTAYIFGAAKNNFVIKNLLDYYNDRPFIVKRKFDRITNTKIIQRILESKYGFTKGEEFQEFIKGHVKYPGNIIGHYSPEAFIIHHFAGHWRSHPTNIVDYNNRNK